MTCKWYEQRIFVIIKDKRKKNGSITKVVEWRISDIRFSAGIKEFEKEIIVIRIAVSFPSQGLDFVINPFNLSCGDVEGGVCNDSNKISVPDASEPQQVRILRSGTDVHDFTNFFSHN